MTSNHTDSSSTESTPPSPATTMSQDYPAVNNDNDNSFDDIFGSSPPHESTLHAALPSTTNPLTQSTEPSDLPSLRRQHVTAGYRDGTSASKGAHVQEGFDGGFPVGAQLGMRAGTVLGIMEGLLRGFEERSGPGVVKKPVVRAGLSAAAVSSTGTDDSGNTDIAELRRQKREQIRVLYEAAVKELDVQAVFAGAGADGGAAEVAPRAEDGEEERAETQLGRKGDVVVARWEGRVDVPSWEENMEALEMKEKEKDESKGEEGQGQGRGQAVEHS
ncbi:Essential protein Yae1, N-terminal [Penicillium italicum]|uniref:Protein YAE1 n=1 Tax=Penicillium italicum TaxID=40296 RepID=A0A0A2LBR1_PENIT|nr:Essential protein Yae1, N-terminal [Penicillium italicum]